MRGGSLQVGLFAFISHKEQCSGNTTLSLHTRKNLIVNAVEQPRDGAEHSRLQLNDIIQQSSGITLITTQVSYLI